MPRFRIAAAFAVGAITLAGCASTGTTASTSAETQTIPELSPDQKVSIVFESYNLAQAGAWSDTINGLIADFEKQYPNIDVTAQPSQGTSTAAGGTVGSVQTQMLAGNAPDVAQLTFDTLDYAVNQVGAKPIETLVGTEAFEAALGGEHPMHENAVDLGDWEGVGYGMPYVFSTPVLFYNATAFEKAGLAAEPDLSSWDKVVEAAKVITAKTGKPALTISCTDRPGTGACRA